MSVAALPVQTGLAQLPADGDDEAVALLVGALEVGGALLVGALDVGGALLVGGALTVGAADVGVEVDRVGVGVLLVGAGHLGEVGFLTQTPLVGRPAHRCSARAFAETGCREVPRLAEAVPGACLEVACFCRWCLARCCAAAYREAECFASV